MGKSFSAIDVKTVLQKLGIRRHLFMKQVEAQTRIYEEIVNAEQASLRKVDEALKRSLRHLDRAHAKLCIDALSEDIGSGLSYGRLGSELTKSLKEGRF